VVKIIGLEALQSALQKMIAGELRVTRQTINNWISTIRARQKAGRDNTIHKLSRLGWTQEEIAGEVGIDQSSVSKIMNNANFGEIHNFLSRGNRLAV